MDYTEAEALRLLNGIAAIDAALARLVANGLSAAGGVTADRMVLLRYLVELAAVDATLATMIAGYPWIVDGIGVHERAAIGALRSLAARDAALARVVAGYPWVNDGIFPHEVDAIEELRSLAATDATLANTVGGFRWVADDEMTRGEHRTIELLATLASTDLSRAWLLLDIAGQGAQTGDDWEGRVLKALAALSLRMPDGFGEVARASWVADGLDDRETALLVVRMEARHSDRRLYEELVQSHHMQSATVSLPLAGDVDIFVVNNVPFGPGEDLAAEIADAARIAEEFMSVTFPVNDIIAISLAVTPGETPYDFWVVNNDILAMAYGSGEDRPERIRYLVARHYFESSYYRWGRGPMWFVEGAAGFVGSYLRDRLGIESLEDQTAIVDYWVADSCFEKGMRNIRELYLRSGKGAFYQCVHPLGKHLLLDLFETLGEESVSAVLRELYLLSRSEGREVTEEEIFRAFLKHTPARLEEEFKDVYRHLHGGSFVDQ